MVATNEKKKRMQQSADRVNDLVREDGFVSAISFVQEDQSTAMAIYVRQDAKIGHHMVDLLRGAYAGLCRMMEKIGIDKPDVADSNLQSVEITLLKKDTNMRSN